MSIPFPIYFPPLPSSPKSKIREGAREPETWYFLTGESQHTVCEYLPIQNTSILSPMDWGRLVLSSFQVTELLAAPGHIPPILFFFFLAFQRPCLRGCFLATRLFILQLLPNCPPIKFSHWQLASPGKLFFLLILRWVGFPGLSINAGSPGFLCIIKYSRPG